MIVGIDIGGTKTHVRLVDDSGVATDTIVATASWQHDGLLSDPRSVLALARLFAPVRETQGRSSLVVGAHGCDSPQQISDLHLALERVFDGPIEVYNDAQLLGPAAGHPNAVALIAGTGSIAVGQDRAGTVITSGGHGWMLSDPGSGPALARESVRAILARDDQGEGPDELGLLFMAALHVDSISALSFEFTRRASMKLWSSLAFLVFEAANAGSVDAEAVIDAAGAELVAAVLAVLNRGAYATAVITAGGVVTNQPRLEHSIRRHVQNLAPSLSVEVLRTPPVAGAIELARSLQNQSYTSQSGG